MIVLVKVSDYVIHVCGFESHLTHFKKILNAKQKKRCLKFEFIGCSDI